LTALGRSTFARVAYCTGLPGTSVAEIAHRAWLRGQGTMTKEMARPKAPVLRLLDGTVQA
jgi:hypothetical protein